MCGIAGFLELERRSGTNQLEALAGAMAEKLAHRGPDASGVWADAEAGVALGHTRLSIIDPPHGPHVDPVPPEDRESSR